MQQDIAELFTRLRDELGWAPDSFVAAVILIAAALLALVVHAGLLALLRRTVPARHNFLRSLLTVTYGPTRLALVTFALGAAVQAARLGPDVLAAVTRLLLLAFVALLGWIAVIAVNLTGALYLRRFSVEVEDNLLARKHLTQVRILQRAANILVVIMTVAAALMTFDAVRQYGVSLFASAGVAGIVAGLAARPVLSNLIAGVQIAVTQPIRLDDVVVIEGERGRVETITSTYVVIRIWDMRRLILPLAYFIEKPFQNLTREGSDAVGTVTFYVDYTAPVERLRQKLNEIVEDSKSWDGKVLKLEVTGGSKDAMEVRAAMSARTSAATWDLQCEVREKMIAFIQKEIPQALPRGRNENVAPEQSAVDGAGTPDRAAARPDPSH